MRATTESIVAWTYLSTARKPSERRAECSCRQLLFLRLVGPCCNSTAYSIRGVLQTNARRLYRCFSIMYIFDVLVTALNLRPIRTWIPSPHSTVFRLEMGYCYPRPRHTSRSPDRRGSSNRGAPLLDREVHSHVLLTSSRGRLAPRKGRHERVFGLIIVKKSTLLILRWELEEECLREGGALPRSRGGARRENVRWPPCSFALSQRREMPLRAQGALVRLGAGSEI